MQKKLNQFISHLFALSMLSCYFICTTPCFANSDTPQNNLHKKLSALHTLQAEFHQTVSTKDRQLSKSSGIMALERPGHFRWEVQKPAKQLLIADGQRLWSYDPDLEQATVKTQDRNLKGAAALFLSQYNENTLTRDFKITSFARGAQEGYRLDAKSVQESFSRLTLIFQDMHLTSLEIDDQLGQHTIVTLSKVQTNLHLSSNLFRFIPPKGIDIVEQ